MKDTEEGTRKNINRSIFMLCIQLLQVRTVIMSVSHIGKQLTGLRACDKTTGRVINSRHPMPTSLSLKKIIINKVVG